MKKLVSAVLTASVLLAIVPNGLRAQPEAVADPLEVHRIEADEAWSARASEISDPKLRQRGIEHLEQLLKSEPENLSTHWKLSRALYYLGEYAELEPAERLAAFSRGREVSEKALDLVAQTVGSREDLDNMTADDLVRNFRDQPALPRIYLWGAINWGLWGRYTGVFAAARQGVAGRIRDYSAAVIALDPGYEAGGGHRILGRLHAEAPKIPFVTGWIDRNIAVSQLRLALEIEPTDFFNRLYYAEALIDYRPAERLDGLERLRLLLAQEAQGESRMEQASVLKLARARLEKEGAE